MTDKPDLNKSWNQSRRISISLMLLHWRDHSSNCMVESLLDFQLDFDHEIRNQVQNLHCCKHSFHYLQNKVVDPIKLPLTTLQIPIK